MILYLQAIESPGDKEKFELLYKHYRSYMFKIAHDILENEFDTEDALHNAFISISKHMDKVQDPLAARQRAMSPSSRSGRPLTYTASATGW